MKNLHILPTDKASRLHYYNHIDPLGLSKEYLQWKQGRNIYITNSEEIKSGDYFWKPDCNMIFKAEYTPHKGCKKVILTTDTDLIKDSVQAIDDEFLEWFVKNPSCEEVEVEDTCLEVRVCDCAMNENCLKPGYTIIIPREEPCSFCEGTGQIVSSTTISGFKTCDCINIPQEELKQELNLNCFDCNKSLQDCTCMEDTIDMTDPLEQTAKEYAEMHLDVSGNLGKYLVKAVFQDGAKWQQQNSYSKEELLEFANWCRIQDNKYPNRVITIQQLFTQFKKK